MYDYPGTFADALSPHAAGFGLRKGDGLALLRWLLDPIGDPETSVWMDEGGANGARTSTTENVRTQEPPVPLVKHIAQ